MGRGSGSKKLSSKRHSVWLDNSTRANPRPDGSYAWDAVRPFELATLAPRLPDVRDPSASQWTFALVKNNRFKDRYNVQLRVEAFNAFNTPIYGGPDRDISSPRFGRITPDQINFPNTSNWGSESRSDQPRRPRALGGGDIAR